MPTHKNSVKRKEKSTFTRIPGKAKFTIFAEAANNCDERGDEREEKE
jgi:hypothetical protein